MESVLPELRVPIDPWRYAGRWFELARTKDVPFEPPGITDVWSEYAWDGALMHMRNVGLLNERIHTGSEPPGIGDVCIKPACGCACRHVCDVSELREKTVSWHATARPTRETNTEFELSVRMYQNRFEARYRILDIDADYTWALVAGDERNQWVWLLARERDQSDEWWSDKIRRVQERFHVDFHWLVPTKHTETEPPCSQLFAANLILPGEVRLTRMSNGIYIAETV